MQTWLIKFGKVWAILKRDGFGRGLKRVVSMLGVWMKPIGSGQILLISGGVGDSARYRTRHVAEELNSHDFVARATAQDHTGLLRSVERFQVFVLHRTLMTPKLAQFIARAKALGKTLIFETDDLVYDPAYLVHMDYWREMNTLERKLYEHGVGGEILADPYVEVATTTTSFLAKKLREQGKQVFIVPNRLSEQDVVWASAALQQKQETSNPPSAIHHSATIRIGYLSGTPSHNKDFATITETLMKLFETYSTMRLVLTGPLDTDSALNQYADRIERVPFVPREELFKNITSLDINLAPLEIGNPFCEAKSELKFFEAGIVAVPTVAAATETFRTAIADGVDGFVASTTEEWCEKLSRLIEDVELRKTVGERAKQTALDRYTTTNADNEGYYAYLKSKIALETRNP
jgi:glycosyltransferase involved in cell wall biosynthesis